MISLVVTLQYKKSDFVFQDFFSWPDLLNRGTM